MHCTPKPPGDVVAALSIEAVRQGHALWFRVASGSMRPLLQIDDAVLIRPARADEIKIGDIAAFTTAKGLLIHRIVHRQQGDTSSRLLQMGDEEVRPGWIEGQTVIGRVVALRRGHTIVDLQHPLARWWNTIIATVRYWRYIIARSPLLHMLARGCTFAVCRVGCCSIHIFCRSSQPETLFDV